MFRFEHPFFFLALFVLVGLWFAYLVYEKWRQNALKSIASDHIIPRIFKGVSMKNGRTSMYLLMLGTVLLIAANANPQYGKEEEQAKQRKADIIFALDISNSMLAEDIAPNRLEKAKNFLGKMLEQLAGDRVGLVVFAGNAELESPLTDDHRFLKGRIAEAAPWSGISQGTALAEAIRMSVKSFDTQQATGKAVILITDGEDHEEEAEELAEAAREDGVLIFVVGAGTEQGAPIPIDERFGRGYKKDEDGKIVQTKLNVSLLKALASKGGSSNLVMLSDENNSLNTILNKIQALERGEVSINSYTQYKSWFQWLLLPALLVLLGLEWWKRIEK